MYGLVTYGSLNFTYFEKSKKHQLATNYGMPLLERKISSKPYLVSSKVNRSAKRAAYAVLLAYDWLLPNIVMHRILNAFD